MARMLSSSPRLVDVASQLMLEDTSYQTPIGQSARARAVEAMLARVQSDTTPADPVNFGSQESPDGAPVVPTAKSYFESCKHNALAEVRAISERQRGHQPKALLKLQPHVETEEGMGHLGSGMLMQKHVRVLLRIRGRGNLNAHFYYHGRRQDCRSA